MDELLFKFYINEPQRESVRNFLLLILDGAILEKAYKGESTEGARLAKSAIEDAFVQLQRDYGEKDKPVITNTR